MERKGLRAMSESSVRLDVFPELRVTEVAEVELHEFRRNMRASRSFSLPLVLPLLCMVPFSFLCLGVCLVLEVFESEKRREKEKEKEQIEI